MCKPILLTGIRPTGDLHLGHYFSVIEPLMELQKDHQIYLLIADLHSLTELRNDNNIDYNEFVYNTNKNIISILKTMSRFLDLDKFVIFRQSAMKEFHYDLMFKSMMLSKYNMTFGNPVFRDTMEKELIDIIDSFKVDSHLIKPIMKMYIKDHPEIIYGNIPPALATDMFKTINMEYEYKNLKVWSNTFDKMIKKMNTRSGILGFATYPMLMAIDILLYAPDKVIVGSDQQPHLQIMQEVGKALNNKFGVNLKIAESCVIYNETLRGNDGRKMSKTLNNSISMEDIFNIRLGEEWFMTVRTFPRLINTPGDPNKCVIGSYIKAFKVADHLPKFCETAQIGCVDCKRATYREIVKKLLDSIKNTDKTEYEIYDMLSIGRRQAELRIYNNPDVLSLLSYD